MKLSEYLKPALGVVFVVVLAVGYYSFEHRSHPEAKETTGQALVIVAKTVNACFSDMVRVTGFVVPKREAVVGPDQEGSRVTDLFVPREYSGADAPLDTGTLYAFSNTNIFAVGFASVALGTARAHRLRRRPARCSGSQSTTRSSSTPKCRAFTC